MEYNSEEIIFTAEEQALTGLPSPYPVANVMFAHLDVSERANQAHHDANSVGDYVEALPGQANETLMEDLLVKRTRAMKLKILSDALLNLHSQLHVGDEAEIWLQDQGDDEQS